MRSTLFATIVFSLVATSAVAASKQSQDSFAIGPLDPTTATISSCLVPGCNASDFVVKALDTAAHEIRGQAYNFTDPDILDALVRAKTTRGVDVEMLVDKTTPCERNSAVESLVNAGIAVAVDTKPRIAHNKVFVIDETKTIEGSFNFTIRAMHNAENTNLVESDNFAKWYRGQWVRRKEVSTPFVNRADFCKH